MSKDEIQNMTLDDLANMPCRTVGTAIAAHFLEVDRFNVTIMARQKSLPLPENQYYFSGNRLHIVKDGLLNLFGHASR